MVDPLAADALCAAMLDLISHDERRGQLAQKSLARAKKFSWHQCGQETLSAYQKAVDSNS
jgi:glycosyltransferase involved in cell wall biosynthesis